MTDLLTEGAYESRVWIDDVLLQDKGITVLLSSDEPALPSMRNVSVSVPGRHGAYDFGAYLEPREFTLNCVFPRQSYTDLKRHIREFNQLFVDEYGRPKTVKLRFGDEVDKFYNVRLTGGIPVERVAERGFITINLTAFDPYAYSLVNANEVTWGSEIITFESTTYTFGYEGAPSRVKITAPTSIKYEVIGYAVQPVIEISGSADNLTLTNGNQSFTLEKFSDVDWRIDTESKTVFKDGKNAFAELVGDFLTFERGVNELTITGRNIDVELSIKYRDKYL